MPSLADLRKEYTKDTLDVATVEKEPLMQFEKWMSEALKAGITEPTAFTLASVSKSGRPSARIVLLKGVEAGCFLFFSNYQSQKGKELDENPAVAMNFYWADLERQVRVEGIAARLTEDKSTAYFQSRPRESQIGAWASPQSAVIADRSILDSRVKEIEKKFTGLNKLPKPKQWGGYSVEPYLIEFWQGRKGRLHDRIVYTKADSGWKINRLAP